MKAREKKSAPGPGEDQNNASPTEPPVETRSLSVVLRALGRHQARGIMLEHLARVALEDFRGCEEIPPRKLLRLANGVRYAVEAADAEELYIDLVRMAGDERIQMQAIQEAAVQVAPAAVDVPAVPYVADVPRSPDAFPVDNPGYRGAAASPAPRRAANGAVSTRATKPEKPDDWEQAVGVSGMSAPK